MDEDEFRQSQLEMQDRMLRAQSLGIVIMGILTFIVLLLVWLISWSLLGNQDPNIRLLFYAYTGALLLIVLWLMALAARNSDVVVACFKKSGCKK
jgi:hypothetical protein